MAKSKAAVNSQHQQAYMRLRVLAVEIKQAVDDLTPKLEEAQRLCKDTNKPFKDWLLANNIIPRVAYRALAEARNPQLADERREKDRNAKREKRETEKPAQAEVTDLSLRAPPESSTYDNSAPATTFREPVTVEGEATAIPEPVAAAEPTEAQRVEYYRERSRDEALNDIAASDNKLAKALERIDMLTQELAAVKVSRDGRMEEQNKLKAAFKGKDRQIAALERKLKAKDEEIQKKDAELEALRERLAIRVEGSEPAKAVRPS